MKVLILGSLKSESKTSKQFGEFQRVCREIGSELAKCGHTVILGSDNNLTADLYVMEGIAKESLKTNVLVYYPEINDQPVEGEENVVPFRDHDGRKQFPDFKLEYKAHSGTWAVAQVSAIKESDVIILIGGSLRCDLAGALAMLFKTPVLALRTFDGAAEKIWRENQLLYNQCGITGEEKTAIDTTWEVGSGSAVVKFAVKLYENNPLKKQSWKLVVPVLLVVLVSLVVWIALFLRIQEDIYSLNWRAFALLGLSAILGICGRMLQSKQSLTPLRVLQQLGLTLIVSFGFVMLYFVDSIALNGETKEISTTSDFRRITIIFSGIGLATGWMVEKAIEVLLAKLETAGFKQTS
jgi:hypothetical protein